MNVKRLIGSDYCSQWLSESSCSTSGVWNFFFWCWVHYLNVLCFLPFLWWCLHLHTEQNYIFTTYVTSQTCCGWSLMLIMYRCLNVQIICRASHAQVNCFWANFLTRQQLWAMQQADRVTCTLRFGLTACHTKNDIQAGMVWSNQWSCRIKFVCQKCALLLHEKGFIKTPITFCLCNFISSQPPSDLCSIWAAY